MRLNNYYVLFVDVIAVTPALLCRLPSQKPEIAPFLAIFHANLVCILKPSLSGGPSVEETPVPIPNTEVKLHSVDGTAC